MKSWMILLFICLPLVTFAQQDKPLSVRMEEALNQRNLQRKREAERVRKIGKEALFERFENQKQTNIDKIKNKKLNQAVEQRFAPSSPYLNFRPLPNMLTWKATFNYSYDFYEYQNGAIKKKFTESHSSVINQLDYSWSKKLLFKYSNIYNLSHKTTNTRRTFNNSSLTPDPVLVNSKFGDHTMEINYRSRREIFYGYDLDYFFRVIWPFGDATRAYAFGTGGESDTTTTTASNDGNLKSSFSAKPTIGFDYFTGEERKRYNAGMSVAYAFPGRYIRNKGTGFWSTTPRGLIVTTEKYFESNLWFNFQKRPKTLEKFYFGSGANFYFISQSEENFLTTGADGLGWDQRERTSAYFKISAKVWMKYLIKRFEHITVSLRAFVPYSYKVKKQIIDEGADINGNREFVTSNTTIKIKSRKPVQVAITYVRSF